MKEHSLKQIIQSKDFLHHLTATLFLILGLLTTNIFRFGFLIISGILIGIHYGINNDIIWRPKGKLHESIPYRAHQLWIHVICGITGSVILYFLLSEIDIKNPQVTLERFGIIDFILFGVVLLSYVGLLPRLLWYFTYAQQGLFSKSRK